MIAPKHLLNLLLHRYHDGRFLNGHPEIAEYLSASGICYVEQLPDELEVLSWNNVRVWSSKNECDRRKKESFETTREFYKRYAEPVERVPRVEHPLEVELYKLCETASTCSEFSKVVELKQKLRRLGIDVNQQRTSVRRLAKL